MSPRRLRTGPHCASLVVACMLLTPWLLRATPPVALTNHVASCRDLTAEIQTLLTLAEQALESEESYNTRREPLRRQALQIAILSQAIAEHDSDWPVKKSAPALRNAGLALARSASFDEASLSLKRSKEALDGKVSGTPAIDVDWSKLARTGPLMQIMKERSDATRKALRRPGDRFVDSRHPMTIALLVLAVHGNTESIGNPADKAIWQAACLELQGHMSQAAVAIQTHQDTAADHFRLGMDACQKCHDKFKP